MGRSAVFVQSELPPMFFLFIAFGVILCPECVPNDLLIGYVFCHHAIDFTPIGQSANISVVDKKVGFELSGKMVVFLLFLFGVVAVHCIELHTSLSAPFYSLF